MTNLDSLRDLNSNELTNYTDVVVNIMTLTNIIITSIAVITEKIGKTQISDLLYSASSILVIFTVTLSLFFRIIFKKSPALTENNSDNNSDKDKKITNKKITNKKITNKSKNKPKKEERKIEDLKNIKNKLDIENIKKIKIYNLFFFIVLAISLVITFLELIFEDSNNIKLSDYFYDVNNYIIIGITLPILIFGLIIKYRNYKQYKDLLNNYFS